MLREDYSVWRCGRHELSLARPRVMGILNVTPDSFSDGGNLDDGEGVLDVERAVRRGLEMLDEGADIIDVGGESTRPGATPVSPKVEAERVVPVVRGILAEAPSAIISVDTRHAEVARLCARLGVSILNDVSARVLQSRHKQWYFGKSLDGFTPIGPWIVTRDEFGDPPVRKIQSYVNGELRQDSTTDRLIFDIPYIISELSQGMTLLPGTLIATGTPSGVGMGFDPPKFLNAGDTVDCVIEGIGTLHNTVG